MSFIKESIEPASLGCEQHSPREHSPDPLALPLVADHKRHFGGVVIDRGKTAKCHDLDAVAAIQLCQQCEPPAVIHAADESENRVRQ